MSANGLEIYATTDNEAHAAAIAQRLIDEGRDATHGRRCRPP